MEHLDLIVENGMVMIPSIFLFENLEDFTTFLNHANEMNCTVLFDNEDFTVTPDNDDSDVRAKIHIYSAIIADREFGNAYVRYLGSMEKMTWDNARGW